ncbi:hypothetical protein D3C73_1176290 [compost metagenome]
MRCRRQDLVKRAPLRIARGLQCQWQQGQALEHTDLRIEGETRIAQHMVDTGDGPFDFIRAPLHAAWQWRDRSQDPQHMPLRSGHLPEPGARLFTGDLHRVHVHHRASERWCLLRGGRACRQHQPQHGTASDPSLATCTHIAIPGNVGGLYPAPRPAA